MIKFQLHAQRSQSLCKVRIDQQEFDITKLKKAAGIIPAALNIGGKYIAVNYLL